MQIIIRKMQKTDVDQIIKIEEVSFGSHHWSKNSFLSEIENKTGHYFTAVDKDTEKVLGYCGFWLILDEAHITTIAVHPDYRKNNIGEFLLQRMIDHGYECEAKWFTLEVRVSNIAAQNLYGKYSFDRLGIRHKYYQDNNEDALIMWTENIWSDSFKENYKKLKKEINCLNLIEAK